jgi:lipoprotein-anchoring transpeptidase ErfK/SrfK
MASSERAGGRWSQTNRKGNAIFWRLSSVFGKHLAVTIALRRLTALLAGFACAACHGEVKPDIDGGPALQVASLATPAPPPPPPDDAPRLGITAMQVWVHESASASSRKLGYLRLGATIARGAKPAGTDGCPGGWYSVYPRGFVCVGEEASLDVAAPLVRAASTRPDLTKPMPYHYGFVRAVAPQYVKVPSKEEQTASEFGLDKHLAWWAKDGATANAVILGANDVPLDATGVAIDGAVLPAGVKPSTQLSAGELFGGASDADPIPFWLVGGRQVANVSAFKVPKYAVFADRVRRHTGLAFLGSFAAGSDAFDRRFGITTDLRLVPATKVKPDAASPFHGMAIKSVDDLPFAWVRASEAQVYRAGGDKPEKADGTLARRTTFKLSGKTRKVGDVTYREAADGRWFKGTEVGAVLVPTEWPKAANDGEKWIDISIENQVLIAWQGKTPLYATLVSTGQDGMGDPMTTKSTIRGTFRIRDKHVTTTMDSNGRSAEGGGPAPGAAAAAPAETEHEEGYGKTVRRGQGTFELRDVPWVQYFAAGFALHTAYWHDVFGIARSHGCINLSPIDGHWLFGFSDPPVPPAWHGVEAGPDTAPGTTVVVHK